MIVSDRLTVEFQELDRRQWDKLFKRLSFQVQGEVVTAYRRYLTKSYVKIPRGAWHIEPLASLDYYDRRSRPDQKEFKVNFKLDDVEKDKRFAGQSQAVEAMFRHEQGQIVRPPGTGKSHIALAFAAQAKTPTLILVHTEDILNQWMEYAARDVEGASIGMIRGKKCEIGNITIATVQTIQRYIGEKGFWEQFGCTILDEMHHAAAPTFERVLNASTSFYRFGFTASATRADSMHPAHEFIIGPVIHKQKFSSPIPLTVEPIKTNFYYGMRGSFDWTKMIDRLISDDERNEQIAKVVKREADSGNSVLVLSRRIEHLARISELLGDSDGWDAEILTGKRNSKDRKRILRDFRSGRIRVVFATQLADEALDIPRLNRIVLAHPGKHDGRLIQQIGRAIRKFPDKENAIIYDVVDRRVGVLNRQWSQRKRAYRQNRISIKLTGGIFRRRVA